MTRPRFELFGTTTSPFVRRVRVLALEQGVPFSFIDVRTAEGDAQLRALTPIWKVPTVRFVAGDLAGTVAWDSRVIMDALTRDGWGPLRGPPATPALAIEEENVVNAVDEALLALIGIFYVEKDGHAASAPVHQKNRARAESILTWLGTRVRGGLYVGPHGAGHGFGRSELALVTALDWMALRRMTDLSRHPELLCFRAGWAERPSLQATLPG